MKEGTGKKHFYELSYQKICCQYIDSEILMSQIIRTSLHLKQTAPIKCYGKEFCT
jgi:hypothetical protein